MSLPTFVAAGPLTVGGTCVLGEEVARHIRVRRLAVGAEIALRTGDGTVAQGHLVRLAKHAVEVELDAVRQEPAPPPVHLLVPVADRDRMLWLAEKATELGCTSWRPVWWKRSRSVSPRGEGKTFQARVTARMEGALAQSGGAWLPQRFPEATPENALHAAPVGLRLVLDAGGAPMTELVERAVRTAPADRLPTVVLALGPEGGLEPEELDALEGGGFLRAAVGPAILRFETAAIVALGIARAALLPRGDAA